MMVSYSNTTYHQNSEDLDLNFYHCENHKSCNIEDEHIIAVAILSWQKDNISKLARTI